MNIALILASGTGTRLSSELPKQFMRINDKPLLIMTLETFSKCKSIDAIVVVTLKEYRDKVNDWINEFKIKKVKDLISGGETRQESSVKGVESIENFANHDDIVLIHDAARVLVDERIIEENIACAKEFGACTTALESADTIVISKDKSFMHELTNRKEMFVVQTPQSFKLGIISQAHEEARFRGKNNATDDAQLAMLAGFDVALVKGSSLNFKVTTMDDFKLLEAILRK